MRFECFDIWEKWGHHIWGNGLFLKGLFGFFVVFYVRCGATARPWRGLSAIHVSWQMTVSTLRVSKMCIVHVHGAWRTHESGSDSLDSL